MIMEIGFSLTILVIILTPAFLAILFGLIDWEFKNRERAYNIAFITAFSIEVLIFRLFF